MGAGKLTGLDEELFAHHGETLHTQFFGTNHWMTMDPMVEQTVAATHADRFGSATGHC